MTTPWGSSQTVDRFACGVLFASTASHGGFYVPLALLEKMPAAARAYARRWSGSEHWYEEDCAYHLVRLAFPELAEEEVAKIAEWRARTSWDALPDLPEPESRGAVVAWCGPDVARAFGIDPEKYPERLAFYNGRGNR